MSQFTCPVVTVATVTPCPNADRLDILTFEEMGWVCVDVRGKRKVGDHVVYIPIDAMVDCSQPGFEFLKKQAKIRRIQIGMTPWNLDNGGIPTEPEPIMAERPVARIKTIKLRGQISQGLVVDVPDKEIKDFVNRLAPLADGSVRVHEFFLPVGFDTAPYFGITKYEPPQEAVFSANAKGTFPSWCPKTDAERYQNVNRNMDEHREKPLIATMKLDGTSLTVFYDSKREGDEFGVCSRNQELKRPEETPEETEKYGFKLDVYWKAAREYRLLEKAEKIAREFGYDRVAIQAELCGPGIQKNRLGLADHQPFAFDIYYEQGGVGRYMDYDMFMEVATYQTIPTVPVIERLPLSALGTPPDFNKYWGLVYPYSGHRIEGVVFTSAIETYAGPKLNRIRFKSINPLYLLETEADETVAEG